MILKYHLITSRHKSLCIGAIPEFICVVHTYADQTQISCSKLTYRRHKSRTNGTKSQVCSTDHPRRANLLRIPNPPSAFHLNTHPPSTIPRHLPPPAPSTTMTMTSAPLPSYLLYLVNLTTDPACFINPLSTEQRLPGLSNPPQRSLSNNNSSTYPDVRHPPPPGASNSPISNTTAEDKRYESKLDV